MLEQILQDKRAEIAQLSDAVVRNLRPSTRNLGYSLGTGRSSLALFVELKRRDPYEGELRTDLDQVEIARQLEDLGIGGLFVATESRYWGGHRNDLIALDRCGVQIPLIRNDFIFEEVQLFESRRAGADAVVLRAELMRPELVQSSLRVLSSMHMLGIVMVRSRAELEQALETDAPVIAVSNRDPQTGQVDLQTTLDLAPDVPPERALLACSGIRSASDVDRLRGKVDGVCLGSAFLRATDPVDFLRQLAHP